jgi:1-acyl-sn-glycerol-3-phosphate acyltransferase
VATFSHRLLLRLSQLLFYGPGKVCFGFTVEGARNLPERHGAVLCSNHASFLDPIVLQAPFRRPIHYLMSAEHYNAPRFRWVSRAFEAIPVDDESANLAALETAGAVLEAGDVVGVFPEGGISRDGRLKAFRSGATVLAMRHGVPLVPAWVEGTSQALPRHATRIRRARIALRLGEPIAVERSGATILDGDAVAALTGRLREAVAALAPSRDRIED